MRIHGQVGPRYTAIFYAVRAKVQRNPPVGSVASGAGYLRQVDSFVLIRLSVILTIA